MTFNSNNSGVYYDPINKTQVNTEPQTQANIEDETQEKTKTETKEKAQLPIPRSKFIKNFSPLSKKESFFIFLFAIWTFIFIDFSVYHFFNLGFTISFFLLFALVTAFMWKKDVKASAFSYICGALSLAGAVTLTVFRDVFINCIMVFLITALFTIYTCGISGTFRNKQGSYKMLIDLVSGTVLSPFANFDKNAGAISGSFKCKKNFKGTLIGIGISIPVLLTVIPILMDGDAAFEGLITSIIENLGEYLGEIILAAIAAPFVISYMLSKKRNLKTCSEFATRNATLRFNIPVSITVSFLSVISVTYLIYLFSQLAYFFSAFSGILPEGYEYSASEYARRGFFEMFIICIINVVLLFLANLFTTRKGQKQFASVKALSAYILAFSIVLIITAFSKMKLYIDIYALTRNRLLISVLMVMLLVIILFYIVHIFLPKISYMQPIIIICSVIFIGISFFDIDAFIAKYDVEAYENNKVESIDVDYLANLSATATPYIIELAESDDHLIAKEAKTALINLVNTKYGEYFEFEDFEDQSSKIIYKGNPDFREYNYGVDKALRNFEEYYNALSPEERQNYIVQYSLDTNGWCYYDESSDTYVADNGSFYYVYSYNEQKGMYEISRKGYSSNA